MHQSPTYSRPKGQNEQTAQHDSLELQKRPEEEATYGSWIMVKKPARRRTTKTMNQTRVPGLVQPDQHRSNARASHERNVGVQGKETQTNANPDENLEGRTSGGNNHGMQFRALSELDVNVDFGKEVMEEDLLNLNTVEFVANNAQNKENIPQDTHQDGAQHEMTDPAMVRLTTCRGPGAMQGGNPSPQQANPS